MSLRNCSMSGCQTTAGCKCDQPLQVIFHKPLVSDDEVKAAKGILDKMSVLAGREQPVPETLIRFMLEEAAMIRTGMKKPGAPVSPF